MKTKGKKRTVLVTGGATGIGRSISLRFAENGWDVICHYSSSSDDAELLKKEIEDLGKGCRLLQADLSGEDGIDFLLAECRNFAVDCLVNNAGSYVAQKHFSELLLEDLTLTFRVNIFTPMLLAGVCFSAMQERGFGRIVNISSIAAKYGGSASSMHYGCSKRALEGLTKTLAREGAAYNVLVNTIRPGVIDTDFHRRFPKDMTKRVAMIPVRRMGLPEEVAAMAYLLGSEENTFITGETIGVAGGE